MVFTDFDSHQQFELVDLGQAENITATRLENGIAICMLVKCFCLVGFNCYFYINLLLNSPGGLLYQNLVLVYQ